MYVSYNLKTKQGIQLASWKIYASTFDALRQQEMRRVMKNNNTCVLVIIMLYESRKYLVFKVLSVIIYCISDNNIYIDYFFYKKKRNLQWRTRDLKTLCMMIFQGFSLLKCCWELYLVMVMSKKILQQPYWRTGSSWYNINYPNILWYLKNIPYQWRRSHLGSNNASMQLICTKMIL